MTDILKDALKIRELKTALQRIAEDDNKTVTDYFAAEIVAEAQHCLWDLTTMIDEGQATEVENGKQIAQLKRFINKYNKVI